MAHPGGVDQEAPVLGVLQEGVVYAGLGGLCLGDDRRQVIGDNYGENAMKELPGVLEPLDDIGRGLGEAQPHEHVPGPHRHQYEGVHHPPAGTGRVVNQAHPAEVGLGLPSRFGVGQAHGGAGRLVPAALGAVAVQRALRHDDASTGQQVTDLDGGDTLVDEVFDEVVMGLESGPALAPARATAGLDGLDHGGDQLVGQLVLTTVAPGP